jgi:hypothetical protein
MDPQQLIGNPAITDIAAVVTIAYTAGVAYMTHSIYRATPELLQVQLFRKLRVLQRGVLIMGLGLMDWMVFTTLFIANVALPDAVWAAGATVALILLGFGMYEYSSVLSVPRGPSR